MVSCYAGPTKRGVRETIRPLNRHSASCRERPPRSDLRKPAASTHRQAQASRAVATAPHVAAAG
jgi:hypothetical protein